jgi:hypothetical protein
MRTSLPRSSVTIVQAAWFMAETRTTGPGGQPAGQLGCRTGSDSGSDQVVRGDSQEIAQAAASQFGAHLWVLPLVSARKGIYKPADLLYALSIKIKVSSLYKDGVPLPTPRGQLAAGLSRGDPRCRPRYDVCQRGLNQCIADRVPVGCSASA